MGSHHRRTAPALRAPGLPARSDRRPSVALDFGSTGADVARGPAVLAPERLPFDGTGPREAAASGTAVHNHRSPVGQDAVTSEDLSAVPPSGYDAALAYQRPVGSHRASIFRPARTTWRRNRRAPPRQPEWILWWDVASVRHEGWSFSSDTSARWTRQILALVVAHFLHFDVKVDRAWRRRFPILSALSW